MNALKKAYSRTFQFFFWFFYPLLPYKMPNTKIKSVEEIPILLREKNLRHPLIVTDSNVYSLGLLDKLENTLKKNSIEYSLFKDVVANPTVELCMRAYELYKKEKCDMIIGFGGGSSIDTAKVVGAKMARPNKKIQKMKGILKVLKKTPLTLAIPTTAGTGSEATLAAVVVDDKTRHKYAINDFPLIPDYAVLDPEVTLSLPKFVTATTGMDALTHAIEAYIGKSTHKDTRKDSLEAVKLIIEYLIKAYDNPSDRVARSKMLYASYFAGCAFTRSYVGYVHAVAHSLSGEYNTPHGLANAVILPYVLKSYGKKAEKKLAELSRYSKVADDKDIDSIAAKKFIQKIEELNRYFDIPDKIPALKIKDIERLSKLADKEANPLYPVPVLKNAKELEEYYYDILVEE